MTVLGVVLVIVIGVGVGVAGVVAIEWAATRAPNAPTFALVVLVGVGVIAVLLTWWSSFGLSLVPVG